MTFITDLEEVEKLAIDWSYELVKEIADTLSQGKPFALQPQTTEEKVQEYQSLRGKPDAWVNWMTQQVQFLTKKLQDSGLDEKQIAQTHPYDTIIRIAVDYSEKMEKEVLGVSS